MNTSDEMIRKLKRPSFKEMEALAGAFISTLVATEDFNADYQYRCSFFEKYGWTLTEFTDSFRTIKQNEKDYSSGHFVKR
jgi:hypothetical protein